jgi:hypothetical protein
VPDGDAGALDNADDAEEEVDSRKADRKAC